MPFDEALLATLAAESRDLADRLNAMLRDSLPWRENIEREEPLTPVLVSAFLAVRALDAFVDWYAVYEETKSLDDAT